MSSPVDGEGLVPDPERLCVCSVFTLHFPELFSFKNNYRWMTITPSLKLCIKQVESCSNWSDLVHVISDKACLTQGDLFWHYPTKSQMQLGTQASCSSSGVSVPLPCALFGQAQCCPASFQPPQRASARLAAINEEVDHRTCSEPCQGREVCYKRLGCFTDSPPWSGIPGRQLAGLPSSPEAVNTNFLLYTRDNIMKYQKISATNPSTIKASNFRTHRKTRFIIHGHLAGADLPWITNICRSMFHTEDVNCILTDWRGGSSGLYTDAVNNVRIVGAELAYLVNFLEKDYGYSPANVHLIGHSLGAHAAGEAGRRKPGIGRITGLDPAGPLFQYTPTMVRLDPSDAKFVDVIHTHAGHLFFDFGILQTCGHLDFYPNGGKKMPGCKQLRVPPATRNINHLMREYRSIGCGHKRSLRYYAESIIIPNGFVGYQCETYQAFVLGDCFPCPKEGCPLMGHYADKFSHKTEKEQQKVYLNTGPSPPYARWRKKICVRVSATETMKGNIDVALTGTNGIRKKYTIDKMTVSIAKWARAKSSVATAGLKHHLVISEKTKNCMMYDHTFDHSLN
ncbi:PREDICTED: pancreatic lipase-related protein 2-like [Nipponia nippon]|uniref:pancreatic lipase-related protein 2-like n=1 Tax=Nipponia nippon TaxID=128390 RepID=UPI000510BA83|nr:PREDICTED: pancreatic lipase-related protein 2-like [Nipponia nippon]